MRAKLYSFCDTWASEETSSEKEPRKYDIYISCKLEEIVNIKLSTSQRKKMVIYEICDSVKKSANYTSNVKLEGKQTSCIVMKLKFSLQS